MQQLNPLYIHPYKYNSWSKVPRGPAAVAVGSFLFGSSGVMATTLIAGVSLATIGGFLVTTAITSWALSALTPKPPGTSSQTLGNVKEAVGDFDIVYGEVRKGGTITFMETSDRIGYKRFKDDFLHFIIVLAGHEVEEIGDVYFNDEKVTLDSDGFVTGERWKSLARVKKHLGSPNQLADPDLVAETSVDSNFRGRGIAYLYVRLDWDKDVFANGTPTITAMVKGRKVYDPRSNTIAWTDNAALCIRDYLEQPFGLNSIQSPSSLGSSDWATGANVSDTLVTKKNSPSEKRYTLNGVVSTANTPRANLQNMLTSCGGTLFWGQGQWQFKVGYFPSGPYVSFNADDLRSGVDLVTKNSRKENFNAVTGTFLDKEQDYIEVDYPKVESSVFLQRDNNQTNVLDMPLPYTTSSSAAQRLAKMAMFRSREEIIINADFGLKATKVKVGDVIQFTFDRYGFSNKYFEVVSWKPVTDNGELKINLILKETSAAAYDWNAEEKDILSNNTNLPDPTSGLIVTNLSVTNRQTLQSDGSLLGEVVLAWDPADSAFIDKYVVQWKKDSEISWSATETDEVSIVIPSVKSGVAYDYRVKAVSFAGFSGPWEQLTTIVDGKQVPPGIPTNLQTKNLYRAVEVTWVNPSDRDLNHIEIWGGATNNVSSATLLGKSGGTKFIFNMEPMEEKWFFIRAVDNSDNKSPFTTGKKGTALFIDQSDVDIDVKELMEDAGLSPVEILDALPTSGNTVGRTVYLTTDHQLYVWDGTQWKKSVDVDFDNLELTPENFPPNLKPVEIVDTLPTTGNTKGRIVFLNSDSKMYRYDGTNWTAAIPSTDLTGQVTGAQITDNAISIAKMATGIRPVEIVSSLPTTGNFVGRVVMLTGDGKIYRWYGGNWTASVPSSDIAGQIQSSQIAAVAASKVTGQLTDSQIADIAAAKVTGQLSVNQIVDIPTTKLTGQIAREQITDYAISAVKLASNAVNAVKIANDAVESSKIAIGAVTGSKISDNAVTETKILDGSISTPKITTNAITSDKIVANAVTTAKIDALAITADKIAANAIVAGKIQAGAVGADQIAAGAIVASKVAIGDFSNLIVDSDLQDEAYWNKSSNVSLDPNYGVNTPTAKSKGAFVVTPPANTSLQTGAISKPIPVKPGEEFFAKATIGATHAHSSRIYIQFLDKDLSGAGASYSNTHTSTAFGDVSVSATAPSNAGYVRLVFQVLPNGYASDHIVFSGPTLRRKNEGELIVDGAIISDKLATNAVTTDKLSANAVVADKIAANAIVASKIDAGAVTTAKIAAGAVIADKIASNAITAEKIEAGAVTTAKIDAGAITAVKIATGAIVADKISSNAVTSDKIEANAITTGKIQAGAVGADQIAANAIVATKMALGDFSNLVLDDAYYDLGNYWKTFPAVASNYIPIDDMATVTYGQPRVLNVGNISAGASGWSSLLIGDFFPVEADKELFLSFGWLNNRTAKVMFRVWFYPDKTGQGSVGSIPFNTSFNTTVAAGQRVDVNTGTVPTTAKYGRVEVFVDRSVVEGGLVSDFNFGKFTVRTRNAAQLIVDGGITANTIAANAITSDKIAANAIVAGNISAGAVTATAIAANTITAGKMTVDSITSRELKAGSVTTNHITANAITTGLLSAGAVNAAAIAAGAVTADKISVNSLSAISANLGTIQVGTANIADSAIDTAKIANGAITNAKISGVIQSNNFVTGVNGTGWRIDKAGTAEFNNVIIRRQIEVASGTVDVGSFAPGTEIGIVQPGKTIYVMSTPIGITEWQGAKKTYLATAGMTGTVTTPNQGTCYWGWTAEVLPLTKWSGNQTLRLKLDFWGSSVSAVNDCVITWKIYEVS